MLEDQCLTLTMRHESAHKHNSPLTFRQSITRMLDRLHGSRDLLGGSRRSQFNTSNHSPSEKVVCSERASRTDTKSRTDTSSLNSAM